MISLSLVVMAAGMGSRYGGLKQIEKMGPAGETLLEYALYDAKRAGFNQAVIVIRQDFEAEFKAQVLSKLPGDFPVTCVYQSLDTLAPQGFKAPEARIKPWGTAHAVVCAQSITCGAFAVINADDFYGSSAFRKMAQALKAHAHDPSWASMIAYKLRNTLSDFGSVSRGVCQISNEGKLVDIIEHAGIMRTCAGIQSRLANTSLEVLPSDTPVSLNFWGFNASFMHYLSQEFPKFLQMYGHDTQCEWLLPQAVNQWASQGLGNVEVLSTDESWCGVTYCEETNCVRKRLQDLVQHGVYPKSLWCA